MKSMTGYGRGEATLHERKFTVEIRAVNHRYNELSVKLPRIINSLESAIKKRLQKFIFRGKVDVYISFETLSRDDVSVSFNEALADAYCGVLRRIKERYELADDISLSLLSRVPDLISIDGTRSNEDYVKELNEVLNLALDAALSQFIAMRETEGAELKNDLLQKKDNITNLIGQIRLRAPFVAAEYAEKLRQRLSEALEGAVVDEARLMTEITVFSDRACIDEELTRLDSHLGQLGEIIGETAPVGRKLDFLVQELYREVNTIGSKSNDLTISKAVLELKSEVEKVREQVQNIE